MDATIIGIIATSFISGAGLMFAIYRFRVNRMDKEPRLRVTLENGFLARGPDLSELMLMIKVANPWEKPIHVSHVGLEFGNKSILFPGILYGHQGTRPLPFELEPGRSATFWTPVREVASALRKDDASGEVALMAHASSEVGDVFKSDPFELDIEEWADQ